MTYTFADIVGTETRKTTESVPVTTGPPLRDSLEILLRMANGLDPFDHNRFKCAVAALPHQYSKKTEAITRTVNSNFNLNYSTDDTTRILENSVESAIERAKQQGITVIK